MRMEAAGPAAKPRQLRDINRHSVAMVVVTRVFSHVSGKLVESSSIPTGPSLRKTLISSLGNIFPNLKMVTGYQDVSVGFDALAFDTERKRFVAIEYRRKDGGLADRVVKYDAKLSNLHHQDVMLAEYGKTHGKDGQMAWPGAYVISFSDHFSDKDQSRDVRDKLPLPTMLCKFSPYKLGLEMEDPDYVEPKLPKPTPTATPVAKPKRRGRPASLPPKPTRKIKSWTNSVASCFTLTKYGAKINWLAIHTENRLVDLGLKAKISSRKTFASYKHGKYKLCTLFANKSGLQIFYNTKEPIRESFVYIPEQNKHLGAYASDIDNYEKIDVIIPVVERMLRFEKDAKPSGTGIRPPAKTEPSRAEPDPNPPQGHVSTSDPRLIIPFYEEPATEFKASFNHDYLAEKLQKENNAKAVQKQKERVKKSCHGIGLRFEVARAIAGLLNSYHEKGRVWVGVKDGKGNRPSAVLGLGKDNLPKNPDEIGRHVSNMLRDCFKKYYMIEPNLLISFPKFSGKTVCLIKVKKSVTGPVFLSNGDYVVRQQNAAQTDTLKGGDMIHHTKTRHPDK